MARNVILPRANDTLFLGALRGLSQLGIDPTLLTYNWRNSPKWHSSKSKFYHNPVRVTNPHISQEQFISDVITTIQQKKIGRPFYIPTSDTNLVPLYKSTTLSDNVVYFGNRSTKNLIQAFNNKGTLYDELTKIGVHTPKTINVEKISEINIDILKSLKFPIIFKPAEKDPGQTFYKLAKGYKAIEINSIEATDKRLKPFALYSGPIVFQEKVDFSSKSEELPLYLDVDLNGRISTSLCGVKHLIHPKVFGTAAILGVCVPPAGLLEIGQKIVNRFNWYGPLMIEFIYNKQAERWEVIEINGRPWLMIDFFRRLGTNFFATLNEQSPNNNKLVSNYQEYIHIDLELLFKANMNQIREFDLEYFLKNLEKKLTFTHFDPNDPAPGVSQVLQISEWTGISARYLIKVIESTLEL